MGIKILEKTASAYQLEVPRFKSDVTREIDVIEELIRIYGFENIPLQNHLQISLNYNKSNPQRKAELRISEILTANGFTEIMNNSLSSDRYYSEKELLVYISNPLSAELNVMRGSMLYTALETIAYNKNRKQSNLRLFEFGKIYQSKEKGFKESDQLIIIASGNKTDESWEEKPLPVDAAFLKSIANKTIDAFKSREEVEIKEVDTATLQLFGIKDKVFYTVYDWTKLVKQSGTFKLKDIPVFPVVRRDLSIVIDKSVLFERVLAIIKKAGKGKIIDYNVFDIYEGKPLEEGQKSLSISFDLYNAEKTMSDDEIDPIMNLLIESFEIELNAIIRK